MKNFIKIIIKKFKYTVFIFFEKYLRIHLTAVHYYSPIPEINILKIKDFENHKISALDLDKDNHLSLILELSHFKNEYNLITNPGLSTVDSTILYCLVRKNKPKKIVEIGSGHSTKIILLAMEKNLKDGFPCSLIAIEPFPKNFLKQINNSNFKLIVKKIQDVNQSEITDTEMLFIDSSHVSKFNSDVNTEIFEIIPKLEIGTLIHWHDIMIPGDYPENWLRYENKFWNESYLIHAFMLYNESFKIVWASRYMQMFNLNIIKDHYDNIDFNNLDEQLSSFWIKRVK